MLHQLTSAPSVVPKASRGSLLLKADQVDGFIGALLFKLGSLVHEGQTTRATTNDTDSARNNNSVSWCLVLLYLKVTNLSFLLMMLLEPYSNNSFKVNGERAISKMTDLFTVCSLPSSLDAFDPHWD